MDSRHHHSPMSSRFAVVAGSCVLLLTIPGESAGDVLYDMGPVVVPGEPTASRLVVGDYDGDGLDDIASLRNGRVDVRFGTPGGDPGAETSFGPATDARNLAKLPDSDGDGRDELVTLNTSPTLIGLVGSVQVWRCIPARAFESWTEFPTIEGTVDHLAVGDFDADDDPDLATLRWDGIYLHTQGAPGIFASQPRIATIASGSATGSQLHAGDFDGNGCDDLLRYQWVSGSPTGTDLLTSVLFFGPGKAEEVRSSPLSGLGSGVVADFDADGRDEVAFVHFGTQSIRLYRDLDTTPVLAASLPCPDAGVLGVGDVDLDGRLDLLAAEGPARGVRYFRGTAAWAYQSLGGIPTGGEPAAIAWARLRAGEPAHPVVANGSGAGFVIIHRTPPFITPGTSLSAPVGALRVAVGNLDGEGPNDFAVLSTQALVALYRRGVGDAGWNRTDLPIGGSPRDLLLLDCDSDGATDVLTLHSASPARLDIRAGDGAGGFLAPVSYGTPGFPLRVLATDFDRNGVTDLIVVAEAGPSARLLRGIGGGEFVAAGDLPLEAMPKDAVVRDLNGDGLPDLVVAAGTFLHFYPGTYDPMPFGPAQSLPVSGGAAGLAVIDANADGRLDLAVATGLTTPAFLVLRQADDTFSDPLQVRSAAYSRSIEAADFDGDGVQDLLVFSADFPGGLNSGTVQLVRGSPAGDFTLEGSLVTQSGPMALGMGDVSGDGRADLLVAHRTDPTVLVAFNPSQGVVDVEPPVRTTSLVARVAPSPSFGAFGVEFTGRPDVSLRVTLHDVAGRRVSAERTLALGSEGRGRMRFDGGLRAGVYFVRAFDGTDVHVSRAVVLD